jgi:hypothetical protein
MSGRLPFSEDVGAKFVPGHRPTRDVFDRTAPVRRDSAAATPASNRRGLDGKSGGQAILGPQMGYGFLESGDSHNLFSHGLTNYVKRSAIPLYLATS